MTTQIDRRFLKQERSAITIQTRSEGEEQKPIVISGYAAVFYNEADPAGTQYEIFDGYFERLMPGCFDRAIKDDDVRCLFNHMPDNILGRNKAGTLTLSVDDFGLKYSCELPDTTLGRDVALSIKRGDISGCSFGFIPSKRAWREEHGNEFVEIEDTELFDVGPVTYPAYEATSVEVAKRSRQQYLQQRGTPRLDAVRRRQRLKKILRK